MPDQVDSTSAVSAEDLEAYVANLRPQVDFTSGTGAPPPPAKDETGDIPKVLAADHAPAPDSDGNDGLFPELTDVLSQDGEGGGSGDQQIPASPDDAAPPPPPGDVTPPPDSIDLGDGRYIPRAQLEAFLQFDALLHEDPTARTTISDLILKRGGTVPFSPGVGGQVAAPTGDVPPPAPSLPEIDPVYLEDPAIAALYNFAQTAQSRFDQYDTRLSQLDTTVNVQVAQENEAIISRVTSEFQASHNLTDEQTQSVSNLAGSLNILPALLNGKDPQTNLPVQRDRAAAVNRALEIAYWQIPDLREREYEQRLDQRVKDAKRKQKLAGISGSSGSVPRSQPVPTNPRDLQRAAVRELSEMMGVSSETE